MIEEWRPVVGWEDRYEVSSHGRVRSFPVEIEMYNGGRYVRPSRLMATHVALQGYLHVTLSRNNERKTCKVHRLMAEAFIPNPEGLPWVRHLDDRPDHLSLDNLAWGTRMDNVRDAIRNGRIRNRTTGTTHCPREHEYTPENTYVYPNGSGRRCKTCDRNRRLSKGRK